MWKFLEQYFSFSRGEKNAVIVLVALTLLALAFPFVYSSIEPKTENSDKNFKTEVDAFINEYEAKKQFALAKDSVEENSTFEYNPYASVDLKEEKKKIEYSDFDPNKIGVIEWMKMGLSPKQAASIEKLKAKGFKFYKPEDLEKIFVLSDEKKKEMLPYVKIDGSAFVSKFPEKKYEKKEAEKYVLDINTADSSLFERQRGIGPSLARRIVNYRERLGGFISVSQVAEVWGLPDSTFQLLKDRMVVNEVSVSKLNINAADFETLRKHPYFNYTFAKVIVNYRSQHGNFKSVNDLENIPVITDSIFQKMKPYVTVE